MTNNSLRLILALFFVLFTVQKANAQYPSITCGKNATGIEIIQVDTTSTSTLLLCKYTNTLEPGAWMNFGDKTFIRDTKSRHEYKLLNSINLPLSNEAEQKMHIFDNLGQFHYFALEFEKSPLNSKFDLIEDLNNPDAFNIYEIMVDTDKSTPPININNFIKQSPVKEFGFYVDEGNSILYYKHKGLVIALSLMYDNSYGKYYQTWLKIENLTGRSILVNPNTITARGARKDKLIPLDVLTHSDYIKKVNRAQSWNAFGVAFANSYNASQAGYSSSTTSAYASGTTNSYGSANGYAAGIYGSINGYSSSYSTAYGQSITKSYNGAAAYAAQQNAAAQTNNFVQNQYQIKNQISEGYIKTNSISNETEYTGFINIKYTKLDNIEISIPINGEIYVFTL